MTLRGLAEHYRDRARAHPAQELLAGAGVAIGVALVLAVLATDGSITTNARDLVHGIAGSARLELVARGEDGFGVATVARVRALRDVAAASPLVEERAAIAGPAGREAVDLVGVDASLTRLDGVVMRQLDPRLLGVLHGGLILPGSVAAAIGVGVHASARQRRIRLELRGRTDRLSAAAVLTSSLIGPVADAAVAIAPLGHVQALAGLRGRVTRVLVTPRPGRDAAVRRGLERIAAGRITVAPIDQEVALIAQAATPSYQATGLFAAIAAICGALLVFNAMLLTAPERRRSIAILRIAAGYRPRDVAALLVSEAAVLGTVASLAGIALGAVLARTLFAGEPSFLSFAFALSGHVAVPPGTALLVGAGGVLVTCLAAAPLLLDVRRGRPADAVERDAGEAGQQISPAARAWMNAAAGALLAAAALIAWRAPSTTVPAVGALAVATALAVPVLSGRVARLLQRLAERASWHAVSLACEGIRARPARAATLAATAAVAVCGCLAIEGAHRDVLRGLDRNFAEHLAGTDVWVTAGRDENSLTTEGFPAAAVARRIRRVDGVRRVEQSYGGLLDLGDRRVWILAPGVRERAPIPPSQLLRGDLATAEARVRAGGWVAVSNVLAAALGARLGERLTLPTPAGPRSYRVAAITTNLGWGPGAIVLSGASYRRAWNGADPTALQVSLAPGTSPDLARAAIQRALGAGSALRAQTAGARDAQFRALARDGLQRLSQISVLLVIAAALSLAAGTTAAIWQRRRSLAALRIAGHRRRELWRVVLLEATIVLATGALAGVAAGAAGHRLLTRWLTFETGYPAPFAIVPSQIAAVVGALLGLAILLIAAAGTRAVRTDRRAALDPS
ncbi:MAG TPA: ABC transporter permease [Conexibacter sp.]|nr:ABC transporter permease [Conexibacter sp.]